MDQPLRECSAYQFHDTSTTAPIRQHWDIGDAARLKADGGNLAGELLVSKDNDPARYQQIVRPIQRVFPTLDECVLEPFSGKVLLRWKGKYSDETFGPHLTSDGCPRPFCLITHLNIPNERLPDVLFFDEPELGLPPPRNHARFGNDEAGGKKRGRFYRDPVTIYG